MNTEKTKIVIFRNGGTIKSNEKWYYKEVELQIVNQFNYLGMVFNFNGKFNETQKHFTEQGRKAYYAILNKFRSHAFNIETLCSVFDTFVGSVLNYSSEVWGFHKAQEMEN